MSKLNLNLLKPFAGYQGSNYSTPYFFILHEKRQVIFYFGAKHSHNPAHKQFYLLKKFWSDFLVETKKANCIVLVEGGIRPIAKSGKGGIKEGGEADFITFLANQENIETYSPEPNQFLERRELLKKFSKEQIQYYYFARAINQWYRRNSRPSFDNYIKTFLNYAEQLSGWKDFDFSFKHMKEIHKKLFNAEFDRKARDFFSKSIDPTRDFSILNKVALASGLIRDKYILQEIKKFWGEKKNIFVVYGQAHAVIQEPVLRNLVSQ